MPDEAAGGVKQTLKGDALPGPSTLSITTCRGKKMRTQTLLGSFSFKPPL